MKRSLFRFDLISFYVVGVMFFCSIAIKFSIDELLMPNLNNTTLIYAIIRIFASICIIITHMYIINRKRINESKS